MRKATTVKRLLMMAIAVATSSHATQYYVDKAAGNDNNDGQSAASPWKTLAKAGSQTYVAGDELRLKRGTTFNGNLKIKKVFATAGNPFTIGAYGSGSRPVIDAKGYEVGLHLWNCSGVIVENIEITSDRGTVQEYAADKHRYGVFVETEINEWNTETDYSGILLDNLYVHHILSSSTVENGNSEAGVYHEGYGIYVAPGTGTVLDDVVITNCEIEKTGYWGIKLQGKKVGGDYTLKDISILDSKMTQTGGSGMQASSVFNWLVSGNTTTNSGWFRGVDVPTFGRGSGIWPFNSENVLISGNRFLSARGKNDSCGAHIDFNNNNVIVEYNFSYDNEGGFCEILGNCTNSIYRYNVSVNDGWRGGEASGRVIFISGFVGTGNTQKGPFYSYIYNNTIYVNKGSQATFVVAPTARGVRMENNIFYIPSSIPCVDETGQLNNVPSWATQAQNVVSRNNLYNRAGLIPSGMPIRESSPAVANPQFQNPGIIWPYGYKTGNTAAVQDQGIRTWKLTGDPLYTFTDLQVHADIMGNNVPNTDADLPDVGAIEIQP